MDQLLKFLSPRLRLDRRRLQLGAEVLGALGGAAAIEIYGRRIPTDWLDIAVVLLLVGATLTAAGAPLGCELPRRAIRLVRRIGARLEMVFDARYGADFHPERPPRLKPLARYRRLLVVLAALDLLLAASVLAAGSPLLALLLVSYIAYLVASTAIWLAIGVTLVSLLLTLLQELRLVPGRARLLRGRRRLLLLIGVVAMGAAVLVALDELVGARGWLVLMAAAPLLLAPPRFGPPVEFRLNLRLRRPGTPLPALETTSVEEMVRSFLGVLVLVALGLALVVQGHRLPLAAPAPGMAERLPIAHYAGRAIAWILGFGTFAATALYVLEFTWRRFRTDPAWPGPEATARERVIALAEENLVLARAGRRDRGEGFLFAPHWWPSDRMYRDAWHEDDLSEGSAGPDFHRHYGRPARRLLRRLLHTLAVDLIYIEDGVPATRLGDVMRLLFRRFDALGREAGAASPAGGALGAEQLGERHLESPPGVHLALQEIEIDVRKREVETGYREPSYESLSRARILLVLRERGGEEDVPAEDPFAFTREPGWADRFLSRVPVGPASSRWEEPAEVSADGLPLVGRLPGRALAVACGFGAASAGFAFAAARWVADALLAGSDPTPAPLRPTRSPAPV